jgi:hypothetical protein
MALPGIFICAQTGIGLSARPAANKQKAINLDDIVQGLLTCSRSDAPGQNRHCTSTRSLYCPAI